MGGSGSMLSAITSLKNNRNAKRSKRGGFRDGFDGTTTTSKKIIAKKISDKELEKIKIEIRAKAKKNRFRERIIFGTVLLLISSLSYLIF
jgi:hypothetical protein